MNVRFPKNGDPLPETTKTERRQLAEASRLLRTIGLLPGRQDEIKAAETIDMLLAQQEGPQDGELPFDEPVKGKK